MVQLDTRLIPSYSAILPQWTLQYACPDLPGEDNTGLHFQLPGFKVPELGGDAPVSQPRIQCSQRTAQDPGQGVPGSV